jgi:N-acetyl-anhydromuramyl-L-alanine amidase AmpD
MSRFYKISIFSLFLLISGAVFIYFSPVLRKEIRIEEKKELVSETNIEPEQKEASFLQEKDDEMTKDDTEAAPEKKIIKTAEQKNSPDLARIVQKSVSWGYSKPQSARTIDTIIIHSSYNALGGDKYDLARLIEEYKEYGVSPHYLIDREGNIYQLVSDKNIAYHAGESKMPDGRTNVNNFSLGIEIMNAKDSSPTEDQYLSLNYLVTSLEDDYNIKNILGHDQIATGRKTDPWNFDWKKL